MINVYVYPFLVLFSFFLIYIGIIRAIKFTGLKIKVCAMLVFFSLICRYICLFILMTSKNLIFLYVLKPFFYLNYLSIPILSLVTIYIIMRNEKFKFRNIFTISLILALLYAILIYIMPSYIKLSNYYGYKMYLQNSNYFYLFNIFINTLFLIFSIKLLNKSYLDKKGLHLIIMAAVIAIIEIIFMVIGIGILEENILGDFCWIIAFIYALNKLKK